MQGSHGSRSAERSIPGARGIHLGRSLGPVERRRPEDWTIDLLAYAAGVIDSDGSIAIGLDKSAVRVRRVKSDPIHRESVTLRQIEPQAVDLFHNAFGGSRFVYVSRVKRAQPLHCWKIGNSMASTFLAAIAPYLRIKRRQAELCVELRRLKNQAGRRVVAPRVEVGAFLPDSPILAIGRLRAEILRLNRVEGRAVRCASAAAKVVVAGGADLGEGICAQPPRGEAALDEALLAYAAGVIDSDGSIGIRRKTYAMRVLGTSGLSHFCRSADLLT